MRGAQIIHSIITILVRIIPADAGSTRGEQWAMVRYWDHPRGCGEHLVVLVVVPLGVGSSPRMRGALVADDDSCYSAGIIPADAGSTRNVLKII